MWYKYGFFSIVYGSEDNIDWGNLFADSNYSRSMIKE